MLTSLGPSRRSPHWRLISLVASLVLVGMAMLHLRQPQTVSQLDQLFGDPAGEAPVATEAAGSPADTPVDLEQLASIRDNTFFRDEETDAWFYLLDLVGSETPAASLPTIGYAQLTNQPDVYRGQWVRITGNAKRVEEVTPAENDLGITTLYRVIVLPEGGGVWPITVYLRQAPAQLPRDQPIDLPVAIDGVFFKNLSYRWEKGLGITPVVLAKRLQGPGDSSQSGVAATQATPPQLQRVAKEPLPANQFSKLLPLIGWDADRFAEWQQSPAPEKLSSEQLQELAVLAERLERAVGPAFSRHQPSQLSQAKPGDAVWLEAQVVAAERITLAEDTVWLVTLRPVDDAAGDDAAEEDAAGEVPPVQVVALHAPRAWLAMQASGELAKGTPTSAVAVVVNKSENGQLLVAPRLAWHPKRVGPHVSFGEVVLGELGVDVGQLDAFVDGQPLLGREATPFYTLLRGCQTIRPGQLYRFAQQQLGDYRADWQNRLQSADSDRERRLAAAVVKQARQQRFSVAPLFNQAQSQRGSLVTYEGVARRAVRVEADPATRHTFGIRGYYELEFFTADSQDLPIVYCATDLPAGFPLGEQISQPARLSGFFVKRWAYRSRKPNESNQAEDSRRLAPLLVGPAPTALAIAEPPTIWRSLLAGLAFVACLLGVWLWTWRQWRSDAEFHRSTLSRLVAVDPEEGFHADRLETSTAGSG